MPSVGDLFFQHQLHKLLGRRRHIFEALTEGDDREVHAFQILNHLHSSPAVKCNLADVVPFSEPLDVFFNEAVVDDIAFRGFELSLTFPYIVWNMVSSDLQFQYACCGRSGWRRCGIMNMIRQIEIDGKQVSFKASAAIPRIYRMKFQRDIYKDLKALEKSIGDNSEGNSNLDMFSLEMFENIAFVMAKHADASIPNTPEEWLDGFNTFSIYQVLPQFIELWGLNVQTDVEAKKTSSDRP